MCKEIKAKNNEISLHKLAISGRIRFDQFQNASHFNVYQTEIIIKNTD
jgi:hypothetical protein